MYRASGSCAAVATGEEQELETTVTLKQDAEAVNAHFDKVALQSKGLITCKERFQMETQMS